MAVFLNHPVRKRKHQRFYISFANESNFTPPLYLLFVGVDDERRQRTGNGDGGPSRVGSEEKTALQSQIDRESVDDVEGG